MSWTKLLAAAGAAMALAAATGTPATAHGSGAPGGAMGCPGGAMGPGMIGMMGPGPMGPGPMGPGTMGPGMMGPGMMGSGMGGMQALRADLAAADVQHMLAHQLAWMGNPNLKVGTVVERDDDVIVAEIVTKDGSLVQRLEVDRHTGWMQPAEAQ